jgi:hypothetical protein
VRSEYGFPEAEYGFLAAAIACLLPDGIFLLPTQKVVILRVVPEPHAKMNGRIRAVGRGWICVVVSCLTAGSVGRAEDNLPRTNDATWARIVLGEELFPGAGVLAMAGAFADGSLGRPTKPTMASECEWISEVPPGLSAGPPL